MHPDKLDAITTAAGLDPEYGQPSRGYNPRHLAEPPAVDHSAELAAVADNLTALRMANDVGSLDIDQLDRGLARSIRVLRMLAADHALAAGRTLAAGFAIVALALVAAVAMPPSSAQAAVAPGGKTWTSAALEGPSPDPLTVSFTLTAGLVRVGVPVTAASTTPRGYHCASVWEPTSYGRGFVGRACSRVARFTVPVMLDSRFVPVGRSTMAVVDAVNPLGTYPQVVNLIARRPSRFGVGTWTATQYGDGVSVYATLLAYTPALGRWTPQQNSPVRVEELIAGRWVLRATTTTNSQGAFYATVIVGGGTHTLRVRRLQGAGVGATNGTARTFELCPTDVPDGIV